MISIPPIFLKNYGLLYVAVILGYGLTEAGVSLSTPRLAEMAAAILPSFQLKPVVAQEHPNFFSPGLRAGQVGEKDQGTGADFVSLAHGCPSGRLALGVNLSGGVGDDIQFHAIVQLFLGGVRSFFLAHPGDRARRCQSYLSP
jgi:hypothetical protein